MAEVPWALFLLAADASGRAIVSVHVKTTWRLRPDGTCVRAEGDLPLLLGPEGTPSFPETDVVPFKTSTDLVVIARAHGGGQRQVHAGLRGPGVDRTFLVTGRRTAAWSHGRAEFSPPERFETIPLDATSAYGGFDAAFPDTPRHTLLDALLPHPGLYPRNPAGRGYVVHATREAVDGLELPLVEDPADPLTPDRLAVGDPASWWRQPLPWTLGWQDRSWFPRVAWWRGLPPGWPQVDADAAEVRRGWVPPGELARQSRLPLSAPLDVRAFDAVPPSLALPLLRGDEAFELTGMTPSRRLVVRLPGHRPRVQLRWAGRLHELPVVPHRVLVGVEEAGVTMVWHAAWPAPDALTRRFARPDEPEGSSVEGVEVWADGRVVWPVGGA